MRLPQFASLIAMVIIGIAILISLYRLIKGPTLPDRATGLDLLTSAAIGFIAAFSVYSNFAGYLDVSLVVALLSFVVTISYGYYLNSEKEQDGE